MPILSVTRSLTGTTGTRSNTRIYLGWRTPEGYAKWAELCAMVRHSVERYCR